MDFPSSTHRQRWLFTKDELATLRQQLNEGATEIQPWVHAKPNTLHGPEDADAAEGGPAAKKARVTPPVTVEEEQKLTHFYELKSQKLCADLRLPRKVQLAALVYFKRFFISNSCMGADPMRVLLMCIYMAGKVEESYISADMLCKGVNMEASTVLKAEVGLLQALHFDLVVHLPHRSLTGLFQDINDLRQASASGSLDAGITPIDEELLLAAEESLTTARGKAMAALDLLMRTDAPLLYPPAAIALAAMRSGLKRQSLKCAQYLHRLGRQAVHGGDERAVREAEEKLVVSMEEMDKMAVEGLKEMSQQEVADIDRRIKLWRKQEAAKNSEGAPGGAEMSASEQALAKAARREAKLKEKKGKAAAATAVS